MRPIVNVKQTKYKVFSLIVLLFVFKFSLPGSAQSQIANGFKFNGNNFADCGNPPGHLFDFTSAGTIEAWVKITTSPPAANSTTFYPIVAKDEGSGENNKWIFGVQNGELVFHVNSYNKSQGSPFSHFFTIYSQPFELVLNKYYHFAVTKDNSNNVTFYVDGIKAGSSVLMHSTPLVNAPLLIGSAEPGFFLLVKSMK